MATTFVDYDGDGNATKSFSFPSIKEADIKVDVDGVIKTSGNHYNITSYTTTGGGNVVFTAGNIPQTSANKIRIFRDTDVDTAKATFTAGSSVKAGDLNNNQTQVLYALQEEQNQTILSSDIKDGAIATVDIADGAVTTVKIADSNVTTAKIANDAVTMAKLGSGTLPSDITVNSSNIVDLSIATADIADDAVTMAKLGSGALPADITVSSANIVNGTIGGDDLDSSCITASKIVDGNVTTAKIADGAVTTAKIAADAVTTAKIADAELKTLAGMQSATASKLADSTALTADIADLNQIDGMAKQTTITDDDTKFPTSGAIVDYVAAQLEPFGGFEAIANEVSFPNTQPASGVAISIADAAGIVVNSSGVSTTGRTVGGTTVTINNIPSNFHSSTIATGIRFIVTSTGSSQTYNYHKATLPESDLVSLSGDINDFNERYRVGSSNPTSSNDTGDLFFNTTTGKMVVYDGTTSAWEEVQSVGSFFINTLSSSSGTGGGSATFNGSAYRFTLSNAGTVAEQHLVSINGVIQKPNSGTSQPSEGFALDSSDIIFSAAPASGADFFIVTIGSTVNINTPSANSVTTAAIQNGAVTTAKIVNDAVTNAKIADDSIDSEHYVDGSIDTAHIANDAITADKIADNAVTTALIADGTITNANISNTAAIDASKIANLATDSITEGNSKAEVIGSGTNDGEFKVVLQDGSANGAAAETLRQYTSGSYNVTELNSGNSAASSRLEFNFLATNGDIVFSKDAGGNSPSSATIRSNGGGTGGNFEFYPVDGNVRFNITGSGTFTQGNALPWQDSTHDIGTNTNRWANVYADTYYGDGSNLTGVASAVADGCIYENSQTISNNYTISTNKNALSAGPITIANGVTLTIPSGSTYTIV